MFIHSPHHSYEITWRRNKVTGYETPFSFRLKTAKDIREIVIDIVQRNRKKTAEEIFVLIRKSVVFEISGLKINLNQGTFQVTCTLARNAKMEIHGDIWTKSMRSTLSY